MDLVVVLSAMACFRTYVYGQNVIPTCSMQPTLLGHHSVAGVEKTAWDAFPLSVLKKLWTGESHVECAAPCFGVIRTFDRGDGYADKRIKATPGETYAIEHPVPNRPAVVTMGEGEYFACGDNFRQSYDSRFWGAVPRENMSGTATLVFWPFNRWRAVQ